MECDYIDVVQLRLKERLAVIIQPLLNNGCQTLENYKYISGIKLGIEEAIAITIKVKKDLMEGSKLNVGKPQGAINESKRSKGREFY